MYEEPSLLYMWLKWKGCEKFYSSNLREEKTCDTDLDFKPQFDVWVSISPRVDFGTTMADNEDKKSTPTKKFSVIFKKITYLLKCSLDN